MYKLFRRLASCRHAMSGSVVSPQYDLNLKVTALQNGLRVATLDTGHPTLSLGVYLGCGSRTETYKNNGCAHFLEHMAFKGTQTRSQRDIEYEIENMGGKLDAYTSREMTCYYSKILNTPENVEQMIGLLSDIMLNSKYREDKIEYEKHVILQEYEEVNKIPMEFVFDELHKICFTCPSDLKADDEDFTYNPLGFTILGTVKNIKSMTREHLINYINNNYYKRNTHGPLSLKNKNNSTRIFDNLLVTAVGGISSHESLAGLCEKYFHDRNNNLDLRNHTQFLGSANKVKVEYDPEDGRTILHQDIINEQIHQDGIQNSNDPSVENTPEFNYGSGFDNEVYDENFGKGIPATPPHESSKNANNCASEDLERQSKKNKMEMGAPEELNLRRSVFNGNTLKVIRNPALYKTHIAIGYQGSGIHGKELWRYYLASSLIGNWSLMDNQGPSSVPASAENAAGNLFKDGSYPSILRKLATEHQAESYMGFNTNYRETGLFGLYLVCSPGSANDLLLGFKRELAVIRDNLSDHLVNSWKQKFTLDVMFAMDGNTEIAEEISRQLLLNPALDGQTTHVGPFTKLNFKNISEAISTINAITKEDIKGVFDQLLVSDASIIVYGAVNENIISYQQYKDHV